MDDVTTEILLRLPMKALFRCKFLSKKWNHFITYDTFFHQNYISRLKDGSPLMLGFFFHGAHGNQSYNVGEDKVHFLPTCLEGSKLKSQNKSWGAPSLPDKFDESLCFLCDGNVFIVASSNGFLLCCLEEYFPTSYYVCNPITKEWVSLPKSKMTSRYVPTGFICEGNYPCLKLVHYKVVRGLWPHPRVFSNNLTIEIFDSISFEWKVVHVTHPSSFHLHFHNPCVIINRGKVHWLAYTDARFRCCLVYNQKKEGLQLIQVPGEKQVSNDQFGESDGYVIYARHDTNDLEIWLLREIDEWRKEWSLKYRVSLGTPMENYPEVFLGCHKNFKITRFHPRKPSIIFIWNNNQKLTCYDVENSSMEVVGDYSTQAKEILTVQYVHRRQLNRVGRHSDMGSSELSNWLGKCRRKFALAFVIRIIVALFPNLFTVALFKKSMMVKDMWLQVGIGRFDVEEVASLHRGQ
ncbi:hypothetical protein ACHQM5_001449 [Ranunculus cassubicifolius]